MNRVLLVVDLQSEFVTDTEGMSRFQDCIDYIAENSSEYDKVIALIYKQDPEFKNMSRLVNWEECKNVKPLAFNPQFAYLHCGYTCKLLQDILSPDDIVDIIGFDTDACILNTAFEVFNIGCTMRIWERLCWSSGGKEMHETGLKVMRRQFVNAVREDLI